MTLHLHQWAMVPTSGYSTAFPGTENPLSEGGRWVQGGDVGLDWNNTQSTPGLGFGTTVVPSGYADNVSHLTGFSANHYAQGTIFRTGSFPAVHEIELLLRFSISANVARGYEILWNTSGNFGIARWNGGAGSFVDAEGSGSGAGPGTPAHGDVLRAEMNGTTLTIYKNGTLVYTQTGMTYWTDGNPGMGFFTRDGTMSNFGWSAFSAGNL
jgi:hypothetical protein